MLEKIFIKLNEGGPFFTYPMLIIFFVILALLIKELIKPGDTKKTITLIASIGWFSIAWALYGHTIGLITAFDSIEAAGELAPMHLASGLKIALLNMVFGASLLVTARLSIIILILRQKK